MGGKRRICTEVDLRKEKKKIASENVLVFFYKNFKTYSIQKWKLPVQKTQPLGVQA